MKCESRLNVLCFGTSRQGDDTAIKTAKLLDSSKFNLVYCTSPEQVVDFDAENSVILDCAKGIDEVTLLKDASYLENAPRSSLHDFDIGFFLRLREKMGLKPIPIVAIPISMPPKKAVEKVKPILAKLG